VPLHASRYAVPALPELLYQGSADYRRETQGIRECAGIADLTKQNLAIPGPEGKVEPSFDHIEDCHEGTGKLMGHVVLITGADSGIGRMIAVAYAREGANIAFTYLKEYTDAAVTADLIRGAGISMMALKMDKTGHQTCEDVIRQVVETFGHIDIFINNAAHPQTYRELEKLADDELERTLKTNIAATIEFCRAVLKHLPPGGSIINTTSIDVAKPSNILALCAATKAALANLTAALAKEAAGRGVKVKITPAGFRPNYKGTQSQYPLASRTSAQP